MYQRTAYQRPRFEVGRNDYEGRSIWLDLPVPLSWEGGVPLGTVRVGWAPGFPWLSPVPWWRRWCVERCSADVLCLNAWSFELWFMGPRDRLRDARERGRWKARRGGTTW